MANPNFALLGLGDNTVDIYADRGVMFPGGNAVNVAVHGARLGATAAYLGCLGDDVFGRLLFDAMTAEKVDLSHCRRIDGENAHVLVGHRDNDRVFLKSTPGVRGRYQLKSADFDYVRGFDVVHTSYCSDIDDALPAVSEAAAVLSYDFSNRWTEGQMARLAPFVDIAFLSLPNRTDEECECVLRDWAAAGVCTVVMTRGTDGALAPAGGMLYRQDVLPAEVIDTLGAGDAFIAGFLTTFLKGDPVPQALQKGAQEAATACGKLGGFGRGS
ncbi:MAG: PfkB family carbohydrate kinase, partial [Rhodospirillales bacterium]|nr:PfkB family carbohydrate kinase [Rhodospirillales bacterium]